MDLKTISQVSRHYNISTRTLRYYEQIGLLPSVKKDEYAYRTYGQSAFERLGQIIILKKLRISLKDIGFILSNENSSTAVDVFLSKMQELDDEIGALSTIRQILGELVDRIMAQYQLRIDTKLFDDVELSKLMDSLAITKNNFEGAKNMDDLNFANEKLSKINDARIVYLPPATVASAHAIGGEPEYVAGNMIQQFARETKLFDRKPDARLYGFNHPNGSLPDGSDHGYEFWITIPDDMEVTAPYVKKQFPGGLYAAHMIAMGNFGEWHPFYEWVKSSEQYALNLGDHECMDGLLEEHLNYINHYLVDDRAEVDKQMQLDLLIPIKRK